MKGRFLKKLQFFVDMSRRGEMVEKEFLKSFLPRWFTFLGWLFLLGGLTFIYQKGHSVWILSILVVSHYALFQLIWKSVPQHLLGRLLTPKESWFFIISSFILFLIDFFLPMAIMKNHDSFGV